ncbi:MAG: hypothetical protein COB69_05650 [Phycisphaera sp.]|nr:MAG: hypothetical protein COB69_05650 [Phycisphaera sp.]
MTQSGPRLDEPMDDAERARRLERDLETLARICEEKDAHIALLQSRIEQLQASRWRKLGQRLRLAMTMDWEKPEG